MGLVLGYELEYESLYYAVSRDSNVRVRTLYMYTEQNKYQKEGILSWNSGKLARKMKQSDTHLHFLVTPEQSRAQLTLKDESYT